MAENSTQRAGSRLSWWQWLLLALGLLAIAGIIFTIVSYNGECQGFGGGPHSCTFVEHTVLMGVSLLIAAMIVIALLLLTPPAGWVILGVIVLIAFFYFWRQEVARKAAAKLTPTEVTSEQNKPDDNPIWPES